MKSRFLIGLTVAVGWSVNLSLRLMELLPFFSTGLQPVYAQGSGEKRFWVFEGHTHPTWSVYARGGMIAEPNSDWGDYPVNIKGIEHAGEYPNIAQALLNREYSDGDTAKIIGGNLLSILTRW